MNSSDNFILSYITKAAHAVIDGAPPSVVAFKYNVPINVLFNRIHEISLEDDKSKLIENTTNEGECNGVAEFKSDYKSEKSENFSDWQYKNKNSCTILEEIDSEISVIEQNPKTPPECIDLDSDENSQPAETIGISADVSVVQQNIPPINIQFFTSLNELISPLSPIIEDCITSEDNVQTVANETNDSSIKHQKTKIHNTCETTEVNELRTVECERNLETEIISDLFIKTHLCCTAKNNYDKTEMIEINSASKQNSCAKKTGTGEKQINCYKKEWSDVGLKLYIATKLKEDPNSGSDNLNILTMSQEYTIIPTMNRLTRQFGLKFPEEFKAVVLELEKPECSHENEVIKNYRYKYRYLILPIELIQLAAMSIHRIEDIVKKLFKIFRSTFLDYSCRLHAAYTYDFELEYELVSKVCKGTFRNTRKMAHLLGIPLNRLVDIKHFITYGTKYFKTNFSVSPARFYNILCDNNDRFKIPPINKDKIWLNFNKYLDFLSLDLSKVPFLTYPVMSKEETLLPTMSRLTRDSDFSYPKYFTEAISLLEAGETFESVVVKYKYTRKLLIFSIRIIELTVHYSTVYAAVCKLHELFKEFPDYTAEKPHQVLIDEEHENTLITQAIDSMEKPDLKDLAYRYGVPKSKLTRKWNQLNEINAVNNADKVKLPEKKGKGGRKNISSSAIRSNAVIKTVKVKLSEKKGKRGRKNIFSPTKSDTVNEAKNVSDIDASATNPKVDWKNVSFAMESNARNETDALELSEKERKGEFESAPFTTGGVAANEAHTQKLPEKVSKRNSVCESVLFTTEDDLELSEKKRKGECESAPFTTGGVAANGAHTQKLPEKVSKRNYVCESVLFTTEDALELSEKKRKGECESAPFTTEGVAANGAHTQKLPEKVSKRNSVCESVLFTTEDALELSEKKRKGECEIVPFTTGGVAANGAHTQKLPEKVSKRNYVCESVLFTTEDALELSEKKRKGECESAPFTTGGVAANGAHTQKLPEKVSKRNSVCESVLFTTESDAVNAVDTRKLSEQDPIVESNSVYFSNEKGSGNEVDSLTILAGDGKSKTIFHANSKIVQSFKKCEAKVKLFRINHNKKMENQYSGNGSLSSVITKSLTGSLDEQLQKESQKNFVSKEIEQKEIDRVEGKSPKQVEKSVISSNLGSFDQKGVKNSMTCSRVNENISLDEDQQIVENETNKYITNKALLEQVRKNENLKYHTRKIHLSSKFIFQRLNILLNGNLIKNFFVPYMNENYPLAPTMARLTRESGLTYTEHLERAVRELEAGSTFPAVAIKYKYSCKMLIIFVKIIEYCVLFATSKKIVRKLHKFLINFHDYNGNTPHDIRVDGARYYTILKVMCNNKDVLNVDSIRMAYKYGVPIYKFYIWKKWFKKHRYDKNISSLMETVAFRERKTLDSSNTKNSKKRIQKLSSLKSSKLSTKSLVPGADASSQKCPNFGQKSRKGRRHARKKFVKYVSALKSLHKTGKINKDPLPILASKTEIPTGTLGITLPGERNLSLKLKIYRGNRKFCIFCGLPPMKEIELGTFFVKREIVCHYFCILFSSALEQNGKDYEGILGFLPKDIRREVIRGRKLKCHYCKKNGATIGCGTRGCSLKYHFPCGLDRNVQYVFSGSFSTLCPKHRTYQEGINFGNVVECPICFEEVVANPKKAVWSPCCKRSSWFHSLCIKTLAISAGYFFKCPLCNDQDIFIKEMRENGIFVPEQDASWEREPNAYQELLERPVNCSARKCECKEGRNCNKFGTPFELIFCKMCGSEGIHLRCIEKKISHSKWQCNNCTEILDNKLLGENSHKEHQHRALNERFEPKSSGIEQNLCEMGESWRKIEDNSNTVEENSSKIEEKPNRVEELDHFSRAEISEFCIICEGALTHLNFKIMLDTGDLEIKCNTCSSINRFPKIFLKRPKFKSEYNSNLSSPKVVLEKNGQNLCKKYNVINNLNINSGYLALTVNKLNKNNGMSDNRLNRSSKEVSDNELKENKDINNSKVNKNELNRSSKDINDNKLKENRDINNSKLEKNAADSEKLSDYSQNSSDSNIHAETKSFCSRTRTEIMSKQICLNKNVSDIAKSLNESALIIARSLNKNVSNIAEHHILENGRTKLSTNTSTGIFIPTSGSSRSTTSANNEASSSKSNSQVSSFDSFKGVSKVSVLKKDSRVINSPKINPTKQLRSFRLPVSSMFTRKIGSASTCEKTVCPESYDKFLLSKSSDNRSLFSKNSSNDDNNGESSSNRSLCSKNSDNNGESSSNRSICSKNSNNNGESSSNRSLCSKNSDNNGESSSNRSLCSKNTGDNGESSSNLSRNFPRPNVNVKRKRESSPSTFANVTTSSTNKSTSVSDNIRNKNIATNVLRHVRVQNNLTLKSLKRYGPTSYMSNIPPRATLKTPRSSSHKRSISPTSFRSNIPPLKTLRSSSHKRSISPTSYRSNIPPTPKTPRSSSHKRSISRNDELTLKTTRSSSHERFISRNDEPSFKPSLKTPRSSSHKRSFSRNDEPTFKPSLKTPRSSLHKRSISRNDEPSFKIIKKPENVDEKVEIAATLKLVSRLLCIQGYDVNDYHQYCTDFGIYC